MKYNNILAADIETILDKVNNQHIPIMIGFHDGLITKIYTKENINLIEIFITELLLTYKGKTLIYFHNFSKFDGYLLMQAIIKMEYKPELIIRDNQIYSLRLSKGLSELHFKDSYLMIPFSLKKAAILFNKTYFKTEIPLTLFNDWALNQQSIKDYLLNDIFTLYELVTNYNTYMKNNFNKEIYYSLTLPSLTQNIFLEQFYTYKFTNLSTNQDEFIRESYLGGIVDIYKPYGKDLVVLDFNSMYPAVMQRTKFGINRPKFLYNLDNLYQFCKDNIAFIKVKVTCKKELKFPLITIKYHNKNIQPTGSFIQTVYSKEILYCLENYKDYYSFEFIKAVYFEESDYIFRDYINKLYTKRITYKTDNNENEKAGKNLIKLMMNSLYGRFGIKVTDNQTKVVDRQEEINILAQKDINIMPIKPITDKLSVITYENTKARHDLLLKQFKSRVDWAAIITAEARILMQTLKDKVDIYYLDTDSIVISKTDLPKLYDLIDPEKLGYLKIENEWDEGIFIAPKAYLLKKDNNYNIKIKGINNEDLKIQPQQLEEIFKSKLKNKNTDLFIKKIFHFIRNKSNYTIQALTSEFKLTLNYDKRNKLYKNNVWIDTQPLHLDDIKSEEIQENNYFDIYE